MSDITDFTTLDREIKNAGGTPKVLEALWDGDTHGWWLALSLYVEKNNYLSCIYLGRVQAYGMLKGEGSPEAILAKELGAQAIKKYGLEFYFPSDKDADDDCPSWRDRHLGIHCVDCNKLILPPENSYRPKNVCFHCNLAREHNDEIRRAKPVDHGTTLYLYRKGKYEAWVSCGSYTGFPMGAYLHDHVPTELSEGVTAVTLTLADMEALCPRLEARIDVLVQSYRDPGDQRYTKMGSFLQTRFYKGRAYRVMPSHDNDMDELYQLMESLYRTREAIEEGKVYKFHLKKGFTTRDMAMLRYAWKTKGKATLSEFQAHFKGVLTKSEVIDTVEKMQRFGCLKTGEAGIKLTRTGDLILH